MYFFIKKLKQNVVYYVNYLYLYSIITRKKHLFFDILRFSHLIISTNGLPQLLPELLFVLQRIQAHFQKKSTLL